VVTVDFRETLIPFSLLQIVNVFGALQPGDEMEILGGVGTGDEAIFNDIRRILPKAEYELVSQEEETGDNPVKRIRLRKKQPETTPQ
jgi:TusA-related sulfurtransferase